MSVVTEEMVRAAMDAWWRAEGGTSGAMRAALAAVAPVIAAQERERCAAIVDMLGVGNQSAGNFAKARNNLPAQKYYQARQEEDAKAAAAIRALGDAT